MKISINQKIRGGERLFAPTFVAQKSNRRGERPFARTFVALIMIVLGMGVQAQINKFSDPVIREIHDIGDRRDIGELMPFFRDSNLLHRGESLMVMGSCWGERPFAPYLGEQPTANEGGGWPSAPAEIAESIISGMDSEIDGIRMAGAFALGQSGLSEVAPLIRQQIEQEQKPLVKGMLFDALGKCGTEADLAWMLEQEVDFQAKEGLAMGIFRFGARRLTSADGNDRMATLCAEGASLSALIYASYFLGRYASLEWLQANAVLIRQLLDKERDPVIRSQLVRAVIKAEDEEAWPLAEYILKSDEDYRIKVNILSGMGYLPWNKANKLVYDFAVGEDPNLAIAAAEAIQQHAVYTDLTVHLKAIDEAVNWRSRALLIASGMKLVQGKKNLVKKMEKKLFSQYQQARHASEKAWLLQALEFDPEQYPVLVDEIKKANAPVLTTTALQTLIAIQQGGAFEKMQAEAEKTGSDLDEVFLDIYKEAIASGDVPMVALAAGALRDSKKGFKGKIDDLDFLKKALDQMQDPKQVEARNELVYTLAYLMDKQVPAMSAPGYNHPIEWERVMQIRPDQQIAFVTTKGEVIVQLNVNWCPGTVSAFLELIERGYFNGLSFHRVVPNFVVQDGCPRGDGWGGPEFTIRSEFTPAPFVEGTLGMASAGKDTEGSQWYFTHSPTPHLDGKYTNFGYVVSGMQVVHQLEVGDVIERVEVLENQP